MSCCIGASGKCEAVQISLLLARNLDDNPQGADVGPCSAQHRTALLVMYCCAAQVVLMTYASWTCAADQKVTLAP